MELCQAESNSVSYTMNSKEMADKMVNYHEAIQLKDLDTPEPIREDALNTTFINLPKLDEDESTPLKENLTYAEIELTLKWSPNLKAPGLNGIPMDLYKKLHQCYLRNQKANKLGFDIIETLKNAYNHCRCEN